MSPVVVGLLLLDAQEIAVFCPATASPAGRPATLRQMPNFTVELAAPVITRAPSASMFTGQNSEKDVR